MPAERQFPAMGTTAHVVVTGGPADLLDLAEARIEELESRWSRFRPDSELCHLNAAAGAPTVVSRDTALLIDHCIEAWTRTAGLFDPTVHDAMVANGYDRTFDAIDDTPRSAQPTRAPGLDGAVVDTRAGLVWLPHGVHVDAGAIGKGLAADLVSRELRAAGADGACVNIGGDLRVTGVPPDGERWSISIEDPFDAARELARIGILDGGVATSSRVRRTWQRGEERLHHVIDPRTGRPANTRYAAVTTVARAAWWAEIAATSALLSPNPLHVPGVRSVIAVDEDRNVCCTPELEETLACSAA